MFSKNIIVRNNGLAGIIWFVGFVVWEGFRTSVEIYRVQGKDLISLVSSNLKFLVGSRESGL